MSQHKHKLFNIISLILVSLAVASALVGCRDEFIYNIEEIPDTEVDVEAEVIFRPLVKTEIETRVDAPKEDVYKGIKSLYVFFFDKDGALIKEYTGNITNFEPEEENNLTHQRVKFKKRVQAGEYYVFAVANAAHHNMDFETISSISDLRDFKLIWDDSIDKDLEMFGVFKTTGSSTLPEDVTNDKFESFDPVSILITPSQNKIHSWVRRAVSKVTIDFDGSGLEENVTVYIKSAVLKDMPKSVLLGAKSKVADKSELCNSQYALNYGTGESFASWPSLTKTETLEPPAAWDGKAFHDDDAMALPCYENMQGKFDDEPNKKHQDKNKDGIIDSVDKDGVELGTYLEVEGYYVSDRPEYKSQGKIIYRFMLGQNADNDFNFIRNHHYKVTMKFKGYGTDIDWHIVYHERYFDVSYPEDVNYKGEFFNPNSDYWNVFNSGHTFNRNNEITVTSFVTNNENEENGLEWSKWVEPTISYKYYTYNDEAAKDEDKWIEDTSITNNENGWLKIAIESDVIDNSKKTYTFMADPSDAVKDKTINELFSQTPVAKNPYNLSNQNGDMAIEETANSYIVNAPGWYCFPLVYGNSYNNAGAYNSTNFVNHLGKQITSANIKDNVSLADVTPKLIWQDAEGLITPGNISFDSTLFEGIGGIKFQIPSIKEGNAVIALIDNTAGEDEYAQGTNTKAIWSWHIWATRFGSSDFEKNITVRAHDDTEYDVMPVNLGWCSGDKPVIYHPRRKCEITFKVGDDEIVRTIEQYPHFALPRGDHPYYQWGRKDPFVGTNEAWGNKPRWENTASSSINSNPLRLYNEPGIGVLGTNDDRRKTTKDCLNVLIKNPDKWHNAPRTAVDYEDVSHARGFFSNNKIYQDLWSLNGQKTIYDPCPPGYQVGSEDVFSGFTVSGKNETAGVNWYDVLESNMLPYAYADGSSVNANVLEIYTDTRKLQSITFPVTGYRDYDKSAGVYEYPAPSQNYNGVGFVWTNHARMGNHSHSSSYVPDGHTTAVGYTVNVEDGACAYHLKFEREDIGTGVDAWKTRGTLLAPREEFYNTDGFAVRPVKIRKQ